MDPVVDSVAQFLEESRRSQVEYQRRHVSRPSASSVGASTAGISPSGIPTGAATHVRSPLTTRHYRPSSREYGSHYSKAALKGGGYDPLAGAGRASVAREARTGSRRRSLGGILPSSTTAADPGSSMMRPRVTPPSYSASYGDAGPYKPALHARSRAGEDGGAAAGVGGGGGGSGSGMGPPRRSTGSMTTPAAAPSMGRSSSSSAAPPHPPQGPPPSPNNRLLPAPRFYGQVSEESTASTSVSPAMTALKRDSIKSEASTVSALDAATASSGLSAIASVPGGSTAPPRSGRRASLSGTEYSSSVKASTPIVAPTPPLRSAINGGILPPTAPAAFRGVSRHKRTTNHSTTLDAPTAAVPRSGALSQTYALDGGSTSSYSHEPPPPYGRAAREVLRRNAEGDAGFSSRAHEWNGDAGRQYESTSTSGGGLVPRGGPPRNLTGLNNLGNTCFMNSCLQCLAHVPALAHAFERGCPLEAVNRRSPTGGKLAVAFGKLISRMVGGAPMGTERPTTVKRTVGSLASRFMGYDQQDAQELLRFLLDGLHDDLNRVRVKPKYEEIEDVPGETDAQRADKWWANYEARNDSLVKDLFAGQLRSEVKCSVCGHVSTAFDPYMDLSVPIPQRWQVRERHFARHRMGFGASTSASSSSSARCTLHDCLRAYTELEELSERDGYYCSKCKRHRACQKWICIYRWPRALVLHVKRFMFSTFRRDKLTTTVEFERQGLDMTPYCSEEGLKRFKADGPPVYDLVAVCNHMGGLGGGHYTADCVCEEDGKWYNFNDARVSRSSSSALSGSAAYMLFYVRR